MSITTSLILIHFNGNSSLIANGGNLAGDVGTGTRSETGRLATEQRKQKRVAAEVIWGHEPEMTSP